MTDPFPIAARRLLATIESCLAPLCAARSGRTLGIVGYGRIGQEVARLAHRRFGLKIVVFDTQPVSVDSLEAVNAQQVDSLDALLPLCDVVSLHCSAGVDNRHLINATRLGLMKEDACLINAAHRDVVDEHALARALWFETIGGAVLGGFDSATSIHPELHACDNLVIMTPQNGRADAPASNGLAVPPSAVFGMDQVA
jgi:glyoxylate reductase